MAGPNKKAYLKSRKNDPAIGLSVFNHVICPVTVTTLPALVVLHSSLSIQFSAPTCRTHTYVCRHISTPAKFGVNLLLLPAPILWVGRKREFLPLE